MGHGLTEQINDLVAHHQLLARRAQSYDLIGHSGLHADSRRVPAVALLAAASRIVALGAWGFGFITASVATTLIIVARGTIPDFWSIIVGNSLLAVAYGILWSGARTFEGKSVSIPLALLGVLL